MTTTAGGDKEDLIPIKNQAGRNYGSKKGVQTFLQITDHNIQS